MKRKNMTVSKKTTRRALGMNILSLLLCVSMLIGTTFAWFTDSVTSGRNQIIAGNLDVEVYHSNATVTDQTVEDASNLFHVDRWEPGMVVYENLTVKNVGDMAFTYKIALRQWAGNTVTVDGTKHDLTEVLKIAVIEGGFTPATGATNDQMRAQAQAAAADSTGFDDQIDGGDLYPIGTTGEGKSSEETYGIVLYWEPNVKDDNIYNINNGKTVDSLAPDNTGAFTLNRLYLEIGLDVVASQLEYESDSFDNQYDANATLADLPTRLNGSAKSGGIRKNTNETTKEQKPVTVNGGEQEEVNIEIKTGVNSSNISSASVPAAAAVDVLDKTFAVASGNDFPVAAEGQNTDDVLVLTLNVETKEATTESVKVDVSLLKEATRTITDADSKVVGEKTVTGNVTELIDAVMVELLLDKNLKNVKVTHSHYDTVQNKIVTTEFEAVDSLAKLDNENEKFFYNAETGMLTLKSDKFSEYDITFTRPSVCRIGDVGYATLAEALAAVKAGETITLTANADMTSYAANEGEVFSLPENVTIDLQGNTVTSNNYGVVYQGNNLTIKNGSFVAADGGSYALFVGDETATTGVVLQDLTCTGGINVYNAAVTLKDCDVTGTKYYAVWADEKANVSIESGSYSSPSTEVGTATAVSASTDADTKLSITGGTFSSDPSAYVVGPDYEATEYEELNKWVVGSTTKTVFLYYDSDKTQGKACDTITTAVELAAKKDPGCVIELKGNQTGTVSIHGVENLTLNLQDYTVNGTITVYDCDGVEIKNGSVSVSSGKAFRIGEHQYTTVRWKEDNADGYYSCSGYHPLAPAQNVSITDIVVTAPTIFSFTNINDDFTRDGQQQCYGKYLYKTGYTYADQYVDGGYWNAEKLAEVFTFCTDIDSVTVDGCTFSYTSALVENVEKKDGTNPEPGEGHSIDRVIAKDVLNCTNSTFSGYDAGRFVADTQYLKAESASSAKTVTEAPSTYYGRVNSTYFCYAGGANDAIGYATYGETVYIEENATATKSMGKNDTLDIYSSNGSAWSGATAEKGYGIVTEVDETDAKLTHYSTEIYVEASVWNGNTKINDYGTLKEAFDNCGSDQTIKLERDVTITKASGYYKVNYGVYFAGKRTFDLNGHTYTYTDSGAAICTSQKSGTTNFIDSKGGGKIVATKGYCIYKCNNNTEYYTIKGGTYISESSAPICLASVSQMVVYGGTFIGKTGTFVGAWSTPSVTNYLRFEGGTFSNDISSLTSNSKITIVSGKSVVDNGDGTWTVKAAQ